MTVFPGDDVTDGRTFALAFRLPLCGYVTAAGRVVYTLEGPERFGFAYGTATSANTVLCQGASKASSPLRRGRSSSCRFNAPLTDGPLRSSSPG